MATYDYDEWGNCTVNVVAPDSNGHAIDSPDHVAHVNPFRYRGYFYDAETGFYYLNSRYYDPGTGRFLNADGITDGAAGQIGANLFVYGANNPVNNSDPSGNWIIKNAIKWVAKNVAKPVVKTVKKTLKKINITQSHGVNVEVNLGIISVNYQISASSDTKGNVALQHGYSWGFMTKPGFGASVSVFDSFSNAKEIKNLTNDGGYLGGSANLPLKIPVFVGTDFNFYANNETNKIEYAGFSYNRGIGYGDELHIGTGETWTIDSFNVFEVGKGIYAKIMEW